MRACYLLIGLCLGVIYTCRTAETVIHAIDNQWSDQIAARTLTGYHEGWQRGRDRTEEKWSYITSQCFSELGYAQQYIQRLLGNTVYE